MPSSLTDRTDRRFVWCSTAKVAGMFLLVLGSKFWMLRMYNSSLPVFDQWEAEGQNLLRPWLRGELHPGDLFAPWVQHRIVWTRLIVLGLFGLNGQWDTQVEAIAAAFLHAGTGVLLAAILIRRLGQAWEDAVLLCILLLFALPFAQENTLSGGFASQYYALLLFAVVTIWGLASHAPGTRGWWLGAAAAVAAWFSVATGGLPALAVAVWMGVRLARHEGSSRANVTTLGVALGLGAGGLCLNVGLGHPATLQAQSAGEFFVRFAGLLGWPHPTAWAAPAAYAPYACLLWRTVRRRRQSGRLEAFLIPLGFFLLLNTAALAFARSRYGDLTVSRYMDFLSLGSLVNFACLLLFLQEASAARGTSPVRGWAGALTALWVGMISVGLLYLTSANVTADLPLIRARSERQVESVAAFAARPDPQHLVRKDPYLFLCEKPEVASSLLQDPDILRILPWQGRIPVSLDVVSDVPRVHREPGSTEDPSKEGWRVEPSHDGRPVRFRSRTISELRLPYLRFPEISDMGGNAFMALVDERSGEQTRIQENPLRGGSQSVLLRTPAGPFHLEGVIAAGSNRSLAFSDPREVGWLSAWVGVFLESPGSFLLVGSSLWLGACLSARLSAPGSREEMDFDPLSPAAPRTEALSA